MSERPRFEHLVHTLAAAAAALLDRAASHEERESSLQAARGWIDLLGVLEAKTKGNLTPDETNALTSVLTDLRLAYARAATGKGDTARTVERPRGDAPPEPGDDEGGS